MICSLRRSNSSSKLEISKLERKPGFYSLFDSRRSYYSDMNLELDVDDQMKSASTQSSDESLHKLGSSETDIFNKFSRQSTSCAFVVKSTSLPCIGASETLPERDRTYSFNGCFMTDECKKSAEMNEVFAVSTDCNRKCSSILLESNLAETLSSSNRNDGTDRELLDEPYECFVDLSNVIFDPSAIIQDDSSSSINNSVTIDNTQEASAITVAENISSEDKTSAFIIPSSADSVVSYVDLPESDLSEKYFASSSSSNKAHDIEFPHKLDVIDEKEKDGPSCDFSDDLHVSKENSDESSCTNPSVTNEISNNDAVDEMISSTVNEISHRRWLSDQTSDQTSVYKQLLDGKHSLNDDMSDAFVRLRLNETRLGEMNARCMSQMIFNAKQEMDDMNAGDLELQKAHSTSNPSLNNDVALNDLENVSTENECLPEKRIRKAESEHKDKRLSFLYRKETHKWKNNMPAIYGAHQVFGPLHRPTRLSPSPSAVTESSFKSTRSEKKRVEKKHARMSSAFLDFFRKSDGRNQSETPSASERRSTISSTGSGISALTEGFADGLISSLQEPPSTPGLPTDGKSNSSVLASEKIDFIPQINKPEWLDLELWKEEPISWSSSHTNIKVNKKERKKQDVIHEFYLTEKHHCQVLVIIQQIYQKGLQVKSIIGEAEINELIPNVLDTMIDFHMNILRRIYEKRKSIIVDTIADIIYEEFEKGEANQATIHAYTEFCGKNDRCGRLYDNWRIKNGDFRKFFHEYESDPAFKERSFKMCLLLIAQRLTKYPVLVDKLNELEDDSRRDESKRACIAVKKFAMRINNEIAKIEVNRRWDHIQSQVDKNSIGRLAQNDLFTYDDLMVSGSEEQRRVICIGGALCQNSQRKHDEATEIILVLFDDILILLTNPKGKNEKYTFYDRGSSACSVIALTKLIIRDVPRSTSVFFIVTDAPCFDLFVITFPSKSDMEQWKRAIEGTKESAPAHVKRALRVVDKSEEIAAEDRLYNEAFAKWEEELRKIFDQRIKDEEELYLYVEKRSKWFNTLRKQIRKVPGTEGTDGLKFLATDKIKSLIQTKFGEIRSARQTCLIKFAERAERLMEDELLSYFNDLHIGNTDSSHSTDQSETDEGRTRLPRRNRTFNGIGERKRGMVIPGGSLRRHTTEPKIGESRVIEEDEDSETVEEFQKLPLGLGRTARRAATSIIKENVRLRVENNQLRSEIVFREMRIASMKTKRTAAMPASALEALRNKQNELQAKKLSFQMYCDSQLDDINQIKVDLALKEKDLLEKEQLIEEQWKKFYELNNIENTYGHPPLMRAGNNSFRSAFSLADRASVPRTSNSGSVMKSTSNSSIPLHLAEKTAKVSRTKKT